jgi:hypothetical protein
MYSSIYAHCGPIMFVPGPNDAIVGQVFRGSSRQQLPPWLEPAAAPFVSRKSSGGAEDATSKDGNQRRSTMIKRQHILAGCAVMVLSIGNAYAGPCTTGGKDAGSGPTPGATGQTITTGSATTKEHPPTETMNNMAGDKAMSSQDAQRQQQGQPTAAQQAQGAKPSATMADQGC